MIIDVVQQRVDQIVLQGIGVPLYVGFARAMVALSFLYCCRDDTIAEFLDVKDRSTKRGAKNELFELPERILKTFSCCARGEVKGLRER